MKHAQENGPYSRTNSMVSAKGSPFSLMSESAGMLIEIILLYIWAFDKGSLSKFSSHRISGQVPLRNANWLRNRNKLGHFQSGEKQKMKSPKDLSSDQCFLTC